MSMANAAFHQTLANDVVDALKGDNAIVVAKGGQQTLIRELAAKIGPVLERVLPRLRARERAKDLGSKLGDDTVDEAIDLLAADLRETLIESDSVEDVFAEDRHLERLMFKRLSAELLHHATTPGSALDPDDDDDADLPPISVRLDTLGYVAKAASTASDADTLRDALERAAQSADTELRSYEATSKTAIFDSTDQDPDRRLEIEEAIEEELSSLVELGLLALPTIDRVIKLSTALPAGARKLVRRIFDDAAASALASPLCSGSWEWNTKEGEPVDSVKLVFTPLSDGGSAPIDELCQAFSKAVEAVLPSAAPSAQEAPASDRTPRSARTTLPSAAPPATVPPPSKKARATTTAKATKLTAEQPAPAKTKLTSEQPAPAKTKAPAKKAEPAKAQKKKG